MDQNIVRTNMRIFEYIYLYSLCFLFKASKQEEEISTFSPTPVSALIHAATMVTAGVYLLMRTSPLIEYSSTVLILCLWIGSITTVFSSLIGLFQQDIKKVIAYSTMSQLAREFFVLRSKHKFRHQTICESSSLLFSIKKILTTNPKLKMYSTLGASTLNYPSVDGCSLSTENNLLNPYYVTGFTDAEGSFLINIQSRSGQKLGYSISLSFKLKLHSKDSEFLEKICNFFNVGKIYTRKDGYIEYIVNSMKEMEIIINHFNNYPLITQKLSDYKIFKLTFELIKQKNHLTQEGFQEILSLKASLNNGLSEELKKVSLLRKPNIIPYLRPQTITPKFETINPYWVSGFVDGDGCFYISLTNNSTGVGLVFKITQHIRDTDLLKELVNYFNCGRYSLSSLGAGDFIVTKFEDIYTKIIPFFNKYPLQGSKSLDFSDFNSVAELMKNKAHTTSEGFELIKQIKSATNKKIINKSLITNVQKRTYVTSESSCKTLQEFNEWLSGLIDGDGKFFVSKKGYVNFKIVMDKQDKFALYTLKHKFGGSIKEISSGLKYKLAHKAGLIKLVNSVNGLIRNPTIMLQLDKVCKLYNIKLEVSKSLTYYNGWFSGLIDSDGSIYYNEKSDQLILSVTQKNKYLLDPLVKLYSGRIEIVDSRQAFQYSIYRKQEILNIIDNYLVRYPLMSNNKNKISLIKELYVVKKQSVEKLRLIEKINYK